MNEKTCSTRSATDAAILVITIVLHTLFQGNRGLRAI